MARKRFTFGLSTQQKAGSMKTLMSSMLLLSALAVSGCASWQANSDAVARGNSCSTAPGGACYAGPGGPAYAGPGGPRYAGPGGPLYAGPGGACDAGPGGVCGAMPGTEDRCPAICRAAASAPPPAR
jgi:hypothetical protein